jgi:hypothetical protein
MRTVLRAATLAAAPLLLFAAPVAGQGPEPVDQPPEFAAVRERFEGLTGAEVEALGYVPEPVCISDPAMGGMGIHAVHPELWDEQFNSAESDIENPPIVLLSADKSTVVGLEWEAIDTGQGDMELFGEPYLLLPGHPGVPEPHYMFHAYFKPDGQVLFSVFNPELSCAVPSTAMETDAGFGSLRWLAIVLGVVTLALAGAVARVRSTPPHA